MIFIHAIHSPPGQENVQIVTYVCIQRNGVKTCVTNFYEKYLYIVAVFRNYGRYLGYYVPTYKLLTI